MLRTVVTPASISSDGDGLSLLMNLGNTLFLEKHPDGMKILLRNVYGSYQRTRLCSYRTKMYK